MTQIIKNMPMEEYLALPRLSASGIKLLLVSAQDFWVSSWMNPDREQRDSAAFNTGTAYHVRCLEGEEVFKQRYAVSPECDKRTKDGKQIYADWKAQYPNAIGIEQQEHNEIMRCNAAKVFKDGEPEVTFLWNDAETNVPMKARIDWLTSDTIWDLKTFSNDGMQINKRISNHIVRFAYHTQAAVYSSVLPNHDFKFVFQQTGQANNCIVRKFPRNLLLFQQGVDNMQQGIRKFAEMYRKYGTNPWYDEWNEEEFTDGDFPLWVYE